MKPRKLNNNQKIIIKFVKGGSGNKDPKFWARESKIAKKLFEVYPPAFFEYIHQPDNPLDDTPCLGSLAWFLTENGKRHLNTQYSEYKKFTPIEKENTTPILEKDKIGEDFKQESKPKNILEFLRYG